nr:hypothetical protein [Tanacetum cinerariifolium]
MIVCDEKLVRVPFGNETLLFRGISATREDDKPEGKQVKDVPIIQDFPKEFSENLPGLPPAQPVKFQIDLIPGVAPVARAPYRLAPSEMKELSDNYRSFLTKGYAQGLTLKRGCTIREAGYHWLRFAGTLGGAMSSPGNVKIRSKRNTHISSQTGHCHLLQSLKP